MEPIGSELSQTRRDLRNWRWLAAVSVMLAAVVVVLAAVPYAMS